MTASIPRDEWICRCRSPKDDAGRDRAKLLVRVCPPAAGEACRRRSELVARLTEAGIECRPIVAGNFVANSVIRHLDHSIGSALTVAEDVDANGLFMGNHHFPIAREMEVARGVVAHLAAE